MAILEDLGLEVKIVVNDSPLQEYEDKEQELTNDGFSDEVRKCRRYVEVVENAEFAVLLRTASTNKYLSTTRKALSFAIDLDGQDEIEDRLLDSKTLEELVTGNVEHDGRGNTLRRFRFTNVSTVDDDDTERVKKDKNTARHLGLLRVRVWRGELRESEESSTEGSDSGVPSRSCQTTGLDETQNELSEKALKGKSLSHKATLSAPVPFDEPTYLKFGYVDPVEAPLAIFYVKYRSRAVLRDEMIMPRSREPSPSDVDVDGLSLREIRRLARESLDFLPLHEMRRLAQLRLLSTKEGSSAPSNGGVKREPGRGNMSQRPRKFVKMSDGKDAVDLTEDD